MGNLTTQGVLGQVHIDFALLLQSLVGQAGGSVGDLNNPANEYLLVETLGPNWPSLYLAHGGIPALIASNLGAGGPYSRDALITKLYSNAFGAENSVNSGVPTLAQIKAALPAGTALADASGIILAFNNLASYKTLATPAAIEYINAGTVNNPSHSIFDAPSNLKVAGGIDSVNEDAKGVVIGKLEASDVNAYDAGNLKFAIVGGADAAKFQIVNGNLQLKAGESFDFETDADKLAIVTVRVTDSSNRFVDKTISLNIIDQIEPPGPQSQGIGLTTNSDVIFPDDLSSVDDLVVGFRSISGVNSTVNAGDTVKDGSSTDDDTLLISSETFSGPKSGKFAQIDVFNVTTDKIENIVVDNDSGRRMDVDALNMKGVKFYESNGSGSLEGGTNGDGNAVRFFNITETSGLSLVNTCADVIAQFKASALTAADTHIALKLENAGDMCDGVDVCIEPDKDGKPPAIETLDITSLGGPNFVSDIVVGKALKTINISGAGDLKIGEPDAEHGLMTSLFEGGHDEWVDPSCAPGTHTLVYDNPGLTKIDGSKASGDLDLLVSDVADPGTKISVTTGSGDDIIRLGKIVAGTKIDGGGGVNVISITQSDYSPLASLFTAIPESKAVAAWDGSSSTKGTDLGAWAENIEKIVFDGPVGGYDFKDPAAILDVANLSGILCVEIGELADVYPHPVVNVVQIPVGESFKVIFDKPEPYCADYTDERPNDDVKTRTVTVECPEDWLKPIHGNSQYGWDWGDSSEGWDESWGECEYKIACNSDEPDYRQPRCVVDMNFDFGQYDYTKKLGKFVGPSNDPGNTVDLVFKDIPADDPDWQPYPSLQPEDWQVNLSGREIAHLNVSVDSTSEDATIVIQASNDVDERLDNLDKLEDVVITGPAGSSVDGVIVFDGYGQSLKSLNVIDASGAGDMDVHVKGLENAAKGMEITTAAGDDFVSGTEKADIITTNEGDDIALGNGGADEITLGSGNDRGFGGAGDDHLFGEDGIDCLHGGDGSDCIDGGQDADLMEGDDEYGERGCDVFVIDITKSDPDFYDVNLDLNADGVVDNTELVCDPCHMDVITDFQEGNYYVDSEGQLASETLDYGGAIDKIVFTFVGEGEDGTEEDIFDTNPASPFEWCVQKGEFKNLGDLSTELYFEGFYTEEERLERACNEVAKEVALTDEGSDNSIVTFQLDGNTYVFADTDGDNVADQSVKLLGIHNLSECDFAVDCDRAFGH